MNPRRWLLAPPTPGTPTSDTGLAVLRILAGLFLVSLHGLGKVPPQPGFIGWLGSLGFPAPGLFAWLAMVAEFGGGILIILGLLARPAALLLVVHFVIVILMGHIGQTVAERELPLLFLTIFLALALTGPGRYSVDGWLARRRGAARPATGPGARPGAAPPAGGLAVLLVVAAAGAAAALTAVLPAPAAAQQARSAGDIPHETYRLDNGLQVILAPDPAATAVAVNVWYHVGSRNEAPGRSGFGHLFEHLMFEGSERVPRGTFDRMINEAGGSANASITQDRTNYFATVPSSQLNRVLWLEADRMEALLVTEDNLRRETEVVKEERRLRVDNSPYGTSGLQARFYAAYDSATCFAYAHSVIGSMEDLDAARLADVQAFFDTYYAPNNATLTVVGAFDAADTRALIRRYFSGIPPGPPPPPSRCDDPFRSLPVDRAVRDTNARLPALFISYGAVEAGHDDSYALSLLGAILGAGETSRLHRRLVREERAAVQAGAFSDTRRHPGVLLVQAIANQGVDADRLRALVDEEMDRIRRDGVTGDELDTAKNRARASAILGRQTVMGRAETLQWHNHYLGDPGAYRTQMDRMLAVTADQVRDAARRYLTADNRAVVVTRPGGELTP